MKCSLIDLMQSRLRDPLFDTNMKVLYGKERVHYGLLNMLTYISLSEIQESKKES